MFQALEQLVLEHSNKNDAFHKYESMYEEMVKEQFFPFYSFLPHHPPHERLLLET
jgi:hypothetical protein